jgi:ankyrin repeat protein
VGASLIVHRFQWAALHLAHLLSLDRPSDIARALQSLPRGLEKTYGEIFERITSPDNSLRDIAIRTFHWLLAQDGIAYVDELLVVACQDLDSDEIKPVDIDPDTVLKACQNLVVQEEQYNLFNVNDRSRSPTLVSRVTQRHGRPPWSPSPFTRPQFRFAHLSVQEYCETIQWTQQVAQSFAAKTCLLFLLQQEDAFPPPFSHSPETLRRFADSSWIYHAQRCWNPGVTGQDERLTAFATRFLGFPNETSEFFERWLSRCRYSESAFGYRPIFWSMQRKQKLVGVEFPGRETPPPSLWDSSPGTPTVPGPLRQELALKPFYFHSQSSLVVCFFGLDHIFFTPTMDSVKIPTLLSDTTWYLAETTSILSHFSTLRMLRMILEPLAKTDAEQANIFLWSLIRSIENHPLKKLYTENFLDFFSLCIGVAEIVHLLHIPDCVEMCGEIATCLLYPPIPGIRMSIYPRDQALQVVSKIISFGANIHHPLRAALRRCRWQDVVWLIDRGARPDIDALAMILECTTFPGYRFPPTEVCKLLVNHGVDVEAYIHSGDWVGTPIIAASVNGDSVLAQLLVVAGADVDAMPWKLIGPLPMKRVSSEEDKLGFSSIYQSKLRRLSVLLKLGRPEFGTALIEASARGHTEICRLLVKHSKDVHKVLESGIGRFGTPLIAACAFNRLEICRILLECDVDATTISWRVPWTLAISSRAKPLITNALIAAASSGGLEICRLLLARGVDVNIIIPPDETNPFRSQGAALIAAAENGHIRVCQLLLDHGANVDVIASGANYPTALIAAASRDSGKVCQLLLDHGADINLFVPNISYCNALVVACRWRKLQAIRLLIARGANVNVDPATGNYGKELLAACMGFDTARSEVVKLISLPAAWQSLEEDKVHEEALQTSRERLEAASSLIGKIHLSNKENFSQVQKELKRKILLLTDDQLVGFFNADKLQNLVELIYDPLLLTKELRCITLETLKRVAPRLFLRNREKLKELFDNVPLFATYMALACFDELSPDMSNRHFEPSSRTLIHRWQ